MTDSNKHYRNFNQFPAYGKKITPELFNAGTASDGYPGLEQVIMDFVTAPNNYKPVLLELPLFVSGIATATTIAEFGGQFYNIAAAPHTGIYQYLTMSGPDMIMVDTNDIRAVQGFMVGSHGHDVGLDFGFFYTDDLGSHVGDIMGRKIATPELYIYSNMPFLFDSQGMYLSNPHGTTSGLIAERSGNLCVNAPLEFGNAYVSGFIHVDNWAQIKGGLKSLEFTNVTGLKFSVHSLYDKSGALGVDSSFYVGNAYINDDLGYIYSPKLEAGKLWFTGLGVYSSGNDTIQFNSSVNWVAGTAITVPNETVKTALTIGSSNTLGITNTAFTPNTTYTLNGITVLNGTTINSTTINAGIVNATTFSGSAVKCNYLYGITLLADINADGNDFVNASDIMPATDAVGNVGYHSTKYFAEGAFYHLYCYDIVGRGSSVLLSSPINMQRNAISGAIMQQPYMHVIKTNSSNLINGYILYDWGTGGVSTIGARGITYSGTGLILPLAGYYQVYVEFDYNTQAEARIGINMTDNTTPVNSIEQGLWVTSGWKSAANMMIYATVDNTSYTLKFHYGVSAGYAVSNVRVKIAYLTSL